MLLGFPLLYMLRYFVIHFFFGKRQVTLIIMKRNGNDTIVRMFLLFISM